MPAPDPQPPKPRRISVSRGLLVFSPTSLVFGEPIAAAFIAHMFGKNADGLFLLGNLEMMVLVAIPLSFYTGFLLEKWDRSGDVQVSRVFVNGILILLGNAVLVFVVGAIIGAIIYATGIPIFPATT